MFDGPLCSISSTTPEEEPIKGQPESSSPTVGAIVGITMGSLIGFLVLVMLVVRLRKKETLSTPSDKPTLEKTEQGLEFTEAVTTNSDVSIT
jgi:hypothetical protein